ncbi:hypothetical protein COOONC_23611 [Cooperia oncophora]
MEAISGNPNEQKKAKHRRGHKERKAEEENLRKMKEQSLRKKKEAGMRMEDDEDEPKNAPDEEGYESDSDEKRKRRGESRKGRRPEKLKTSRLVDEAFQKAAKLVPQQVRSDSAAHSPPETPKEKRYFIWNLSLAPRQL